jgi:streptogramin lyase
LLRPFTLCLATLFSSALLGGCGNVQQQSATTTTATVTPPTPPTPSTTPGSPILGNVHGGQQPVTGAHIYLFGASSSDYATRSTSMLNPAQPGVFNDATGNYVLTGSNGNFSISGDYTCTQGQQVYLLATGGNPGLPDSDQINPALVLMAAIGACPEGQTNFASTVPYVYINEVSTIGAVYALSGFMTDGAHLSSAATPGALHGIANAFLTIKNLVDLGTGTAFSQSVEGNGTVPQAEINSLANLLVTCVNSDGTTACAPLFSAAPALDGTLPTNTLTAILNIAHNPGTNAAAIFTASLTTTPFQPALTTAPSDWSLAITFYADNMVGPYFPAIDSIGDIWIPDYANSQLTILGPNGNVLSGSGISDGGLNLPYAIAIDSSDNAWITNFGPPGASTVSKFSPTGTALTSTPYACASACFFPAFDASQNLWLSGSDHTTVLAPSGAVLKQFATSAYDSGIAINSAGTAWTLGQPRSLYRLSLSGAASPVSEFVTAATGTELTPLAIDSADNVWYVSNKNNAIGVSDKNGNILSPFTGYTGGGLQGPAQIAIDGSNRVWVANRDGNSLSAFTSNGKAISPATGYQAAGLSNPRGLAIDPSGNAWLTNFTYNSITEFIGIATPAATPISSTNHGQRP